MGWLFGFRGDGFGMAVGVPGGGCWMLFGMILGWYFLMSGWFFWRPRKCFGKAFGFSGDDFWKGFLASQGMALGCCTGVPGWFWGGFWGDKGVLGDYARGSRDDAGMIDGVAGAGFGIALCVPG